MVSNNYVSLAKSKPFQSRLDYEGLQWGDRLKN